MKTMTKTSKKAFAFLLIFVLIFSCLTVFSSTEALAATSKVTKKTVNATTIKAKTENVIYNDKPAIRLSWETSGVDVDYYQVYRSTSKTFSKNAKAFYTTKTGEKTTYTNTKSLKLGKRYYYKVRGVKVINGKKYYTKWSNIAYRTVRYPVADSVYYNGNIYTVDDDFSTASALAVVDDRLIYVGKNSVAKKLIGKKTDVVDLEGKTVLPGLNDGHLHLTQCGEYRLQLNAFWKPKDEILASVKAAAEAAEPGEWIRGYGWMNAIWENKDYPTKEELDAVAPDNPVFLSHASGHMAWVNSKAFETVGITNNTPDPQGGVYMKDASGELTGCVTDNAILVFWGAMPGYTVEQEMEGLLRIQEELFSYGITSVTDAGNTVPNLKEVFIPMYESGDLKLRTNLMINIQSLEGEEADYVRNNEPQRGLYDNHLDIQGVKLFADGALGSRSAAMLEDFSDLEGHSGTYIWSDEEMDQLVELAYNNGYQIGTHAIGDGGNRQVIDAYEKVIKANPRDHRLRIEHFQIVDLDDIARAIELDILPSMQTTHATSDMLVAEDRVGSERIKGAYAWRTIIEQGSIIVNGTDAPVEATNPYHSLYAAVTRKDKLGQPSEGWYPEQCMTREEALRSYTTWNAYGEFNEDIKGSLEVGKLADFVVIDRDYMTCPEEDIKDIQALMTVSGGEVVYTKDTAVPTIMWSGSPITFNHDLIEEGSEVWVPLNDAVNAVSAEAKEEGSKVKVTLDSKSVTLPVKEKNGVAYVEATALFEGLGRNVHWYEESRCLSIGWLE